MGLFGRHHPILIIRSGSRKGKRLRLRRDTVLLGADGKCQVVLKDPGVEAKHATLRRRNTDQWELENHAAGGVQVDKLPVQKKLLRHGAQIRLGSSTLLEFTLPAAATRDAGGALRRQGISPRIMVGIGIYWLLLLLGVMYFRQVETRAAAWPTLRVGAVEQALEGTRGFLGEHRNRSETVQPLRIDPDGEEAANYHALVYQDGGDIDRVRNALRINTILDELEQLFQRAWHLESQRRWRAARETYRQITRLVPDIRAPATALATDRLRRLRQVINDDD